jgi:hypothetical protein
MYGSTKVIVFVHGSEHTPDVPQEPFCGHPVRKMIVTQGHPDSWVQNPGYVIMQKPTIIPTSSEK